MLSAQAVSLRDLAARFRRRHHYMCRGPYSVTELVLIQFAAEVADSLALHTETMIKQQALKARLLPNRERVQLLEAEPRVDVGEERSREIIEELEELDLEEIRVTWRSGISENKPRPKKSKNSLSTISHLVSYEAAQRSDISVGADQDLRNMRAAFLAGC